MVKKGIEMQINNNLNGTYGSYQGPSQSRVDQRQQKPATQLATREAIRPEKELDKVIDQDTRAQLLARNAYAGLPQRGGLLDIVV